METESGWRPPPPTHLLAASSARQTDRLSLWRNLPRASPAEPGFHTGQDQEKETSGSKYHEQLDKTATEELPLERVCPRGTLPQQLPKATTTAGPGDGVTLAFCRSQADRSHSAMARDGQGRGKPERGEGATSPPRGCSAQLPGKATPTPIIL